MKKRWFKPDLTPYEELKIDLPAEGTPLRIGCSATREPFNFVDENGRVTGHDGELARLIAAKLKRAIAVFDVSGSGVITTNDVRRALRDVLKEAEVNSIVKSVDPANTGKVYVQQLSEFLVGF